MKQRARTQTPKRAHRSLRIPIELDEQIIRIAGQQKQSYSAVLCAGLRYAFEEKSAASLSAGTADTPSAQNAFLRRYLADEI
ncbi:hypothetical protein Q4S25_11030 [Morganella morganii]